VTPGRDRTPSGGLAVVLAVWATLLLFGQTGRTGGDEDLHIIAAMRTAAGQQPYLDYFYQHPPLFVYAAAAWFRALGEGWRSAHLLAAGLTGLAILLLARSAGACLPDRPPRIVMTTAVLVGLHATTVTTGTIGHPYALTLVFLATAYALTLAAQNRSTWLRATGAGAAAVGAAASSLLAIVAVPIMLGWLVRRVPAASRRRVATAFVAGGLVPLVPILALASRRPGAVLFDLVGFHVLWRSAASGWAPSTAEYFLWNPHEVLSTWVEFPQSLILLLLAGIGLAQRDARTRPPALSLAVWLAVGLGVYVACIIPTSFRYFIIVLPFAGLLAADGLEQVAAGGASLRRRQVLVLTVLALFLAGLVRPVYREFKRVDTATMTAQHYRWQDWERVARQVNAVTPPGGLLYAPSWIYVATGRLPFGPLGNRYGLRLAAAGEPRVQPDGRSPVFAWLAEGRFDTVVLHPGDPEFSAIQASGRYGESAQVLTYRVLHR
jgi:hypothetical protein